MAFRNTERVNVFFQLGNPIGLQKDCHWNIGSGRVSYLPKLMMYIKPGEEGGEVMVVRKSS